MTAAEWAQTREHTILETASIGISSEDPEGRSGRVRYFDSNSMASGMAKEGQARKPP